MCTLLSKSQMCHRLLAGFVLTLMLLSQPAFATLNLSIDQVSAPAGTQAVVSVKADGFTNMVTTQGSIQFDPVVASFSNIQVFGLPGMSNANFSLANVSSGFISFSWDDTNFPNQSTSGVTLANGSVLFSIKFNLIGNPGQTTDVKLISSPTTLEFTDNSSNTVAYQLADGHITLTQPCQTYLNCDDGDLCTIDDCINSACTHEPDPCDDFFPCTIDNCDPQNGCSHESTCTDEDSDPCTIEYCYYNGCASYPMQCYDGDPCTSDDCDGGQCPYTPVICDDENLCTTDYCNEAGLCKSNPVDCEDEIPCTDDHCEPATGECKHDPTPQLELDVQIPVCNGQYGTITPIATGGTPFYEFFIPGFDPFLDFISVPPGSYEVTVVDLYGCTAVAFTEFFEPDPCDDGIACNGVEICNGITGECIPGNQLNCDDNSPCTDDHCDMETGECWHLFNCSLDPSCCDDNNPCTEDICNGETCSYTEFSVSLETTDATCFCNGAIDLSTNGGNEPFMAYFWSNESTTEDLASICPGDYSVTVYDAYQCSATATTTVSGPEPLEAEFTGNAPLCHDGEGSISQTTTGGIGPYRYYIVAMRDPDCGTGSGSINDFENGGNGFHFGFANPFMAFALTLPGITDACYVLLIEPIEIEFNPDYITNPGDFLIEITDANGCAIYRTVTVPNPPLLELSLNPINPLCPGENGSVTGTATGGTEPYHYYLNYADDRLEVYFDPAYSVGAGTYEFTVEDANGCTATTTVEIIEPELLSLNFAPVHATCYNSCNGAIDLQVSGGNSAYYSFAWSNDTYAEDLDNLCAGEYSVTVYDASQCSATSSVEITQPDFISIEAAAVANPTCFGSCDGFAEIANISGGTPPYNYVWTGNNYDWETVDLAIVFAEGIHSLRYDGLCGNEDSYTDESGNIINLGIYRFIVQDANGCLKDIVVPLSEPTPLSRNAELKNPTCFASCDGYAEAILLGGTPPYAFEWNNGATTARIENLCVGIYPCTGTDANGCELPFEIELSEPELLQLELTGASPLCIGRSGTVTGSATGGTPPYHYYLHTAAGDRLEVYFYPAYSIGAGTYDFEVEDDNGCTATQIVEVIDAAACADDSDPCTYDYCDQLTGACNHNYDCNLSASCCDDNNACTNDFCITNNQGNPECFHAPVVCDDNNPCTNNLCNALGQCEYPPFDCSDNNLCTNDVCYPNNFGGPECSHQQKDCADTNPCTDDRCEQTNGECKHDTKNCDDENPCTTDECNAVGICKSSPMDCVDTDPCTLDKCTDGACEHIHISGCCHTATDCDDNNLCTLEYCDNNECASSPVPCYDGNDCTIDHCESANGECKHDFDCRLSNFCCDDNNLCTDDFCGTATNPAECGHEPVNCDDQNPCTTDECNEVGQCKFTTNDCNDNDFCTIDVCFTNNSGEAECNHQPRSCDDGNICTEDVCVNACQNNNIPNCCHQAADCEDNNLCTFDKCTANECENVPITNCCLTVADCNDNDGCTTDACSPNHVCVYSSTGLELSLEVQNPLCHGENGTITPTATGGTPPYFFFGPTSGGGLSLPPLFTGSPLPAGTYEILVTDANLCSASDFATISEPPLCNDDNPCTNDACNEFGQCSFTQVSCDDNDFCTIDICFTNNFGEAECAHQPRNCDDNNVCTEDVCVNACQNNNIPNCCHQAADCEDNNLCTFDKCTANECESVTITNCCLTTANCDDNNLCTTDECSPNHVCVHDAVNCNDNFPCTIDKCEPQDGSCSHQSTCTDDGNPCTIEYCYYNGCTFSTVDCDDENPCTNDFCGTVNPLDCTHEAKNCDDGNPCTIDECNAAGECKYNPNYVTLTFDITNTLSCLCNGAVDLHISGGSGSYSYSWDNGVTTEDLSGLCASVYTVTVTDDKGCSATASAEVLNTPSLSAFTHYTAKCNGLADITIFISGFPPHTFYADGNPVTATETIEGTLTENGYTITEAHYDMTVPQGSTITWTDITGCPEPSVSVPVIPQVCDDEIECTFDFCDASNGICRAHFDCTLSASCCDDGNLCTTDECFDNGGNYECLHSPVANCCQTAAECDDGNLCTTDECMDYTCMITLVDCDDHEPCTIDGCDNGQCTNEPYGYLLSRTFASPTCKEKCDGFADATFTGGIAPFTFSWSTGETTQRIENLCANEFDETSGLYFGTYLCTVTDVNGCIAEYNFTLQDPEVLQLDLDGESPLCHGENGTITPTATGGTTPYTFFGPGSEPFDGSLSVPAGAYEISVKDANGCTATATVIIDEAPSELDLQFVFADTLCENFSYLQFVAQGGTAPYNVELSYANSDFTFPDEFTSSVFIPEAGGLSQVCGFGTGTYVFLLTDANGCTAKDSFYFAGPGYVDLIFDVVPPPCYGDLAIVTPSVYTEPGSRGYEPPYTYYGPDGNEFSGSISLPAGVHRIRVVDANGCIIENEVIITDPIPCDDFILCTVDVCTDGDCSHTPIANCCQSLVDCSDNDPCTSSDCVDNVCVFTLTICDDGVECTFDFCDALNGICRAHFDCTLSASCCDDGNLCTTDECFDNGGNYECLHNSIANCCQSLVDCSDNNPCTSADCVDFRCVFTPITCYDGNPCTDDVCVDGLCPFTPIPNCCQTTAECDDDNLCTTNECINNLCETTPLDCDDEEACTTDECVEGECAHAQLCDDGDACTDDICADGVCGNHVSNNPVIDIFFDKEIYCPGEPIYVIDHSTETIPPIQIGISYPDFDQVPLESTIYYANDPVIESDGERWYLGYPDGIDYIRQHDTLAVMNPPSEASGTLLYRVRIMNPNGCASESMTISATILNCNDDNPCTEDGCANGECSHTPIDCDDEDACTTDECVEAECAHAQLCNDGDACSDDICVDGVCDYIPFEPVVDIFFDKEVYCPGEPIYIINHSTGVDPESNYYFDDFTVTTDGGTVIIPFTDVTIINSGDILGQLPDVPSGVIHTSVAIGKHDLILGCISDPVELQATILNCNDGNPCTEDGCANGECSHTRIANCCVTVADCDDRDVCTNDLCVPDENGTIHGSCSHTPFCEDGNPCTIDICVITTDGPACRHIPVACADGNDCTDDFCLISNTNTAECYNPAKDCSDTDPCTNDFCDNGCKHSPVDCNDNQACSNDFCDNGCKHSPVDCNDNQACTNDFCDNGCKHTTVVCNDNNACTSNFCNPASGCFYPPITCNDNNSCTDNSCNPLSGCVFPPLDCNDGNSCTLDFCDNGCKHTAISCSDNNACTNDLCNPNSGCFYTNNNNASCSDNNACTLNDKCFGGSCVPGNFRNCSDNNICTNDNCNPNTGSCFFTNNTASCSDGNACTLNDACANGSCAPGPLKNCSDNNTCTNDFCNPNSGNCFNQNNNNANCSDGNVCTLNDACFNGNCVPGFARNCNDFDACTADACNPASGCTSTQLNCNDNNPCTIDYCNNGCKYTPIPSSLTISVSQAPAFCQDNTVSLTAIAPSTTSFLWSTGATTPSISATIGVNYSVTATFAGGCTRTASRTVTLQSLLSAYVIVAEREVDLDKNTVYSGGVGVTNLGGQLRLRDGSIVTAIGTFTMADHINLSGGSVATVQIPTPAPVTLPPFEYNPSCNGQNLNIPNNVAVTINGSNYRDVRIGWNSIVTFTQTNINMRSLEVEENSEVRFNDCTRLHICEEMQLERNNRFNIAGNDMVVYVEDDVTIQRGSRVTADIYTLDDIEVEDASQSNPNILRGLFIAERVEGGEFTYWYTNPGCNSQCAGSNLTAAKLSNEDTGDEGQSFSQTEPMPLTDIVKLSAYPNPFSDKLNIQFTLPYDSKVSLEVYNMAGQRLDVVFTGDVKAGELNKAEFKSVAAGSGLIIYRLITEHGIYHDKAVMVR